MVRGRLHGHLSFDPRPGVHRLAGGGASGDSNGAIHLGAAVGVLTHPWHGTTGPNGGRGVHDYNNCTRAMDFARQKSVYGCKF